MQQNVGGSWLQADRNSPQPFWLKVLFVSTTLYSTTLYFKMSDSESESDVRSLVGLASLASSPARSCGLGSLAASDEDDAVGDEERPVPLVISTSATIFIDVR